MVNSRWWHVAVLGTTIIIAGLVLASEEWGWRAWGGIASAAAIGLGWALVGRHACRSERAGLAYSIILVVAIAAGTGFVPYFAFVQFIAYPLVWTMAPSVRAAIGWNFAIVGAVSVGFVFSVGTDPSELWRTVIIQLIAVGFSIAFGLWITSIANRSEERQRLLDELQATQSQLASLNRDVGVTTERERLAREIHDTIAQDLTGLVMLAERARSVEDPTARHDLLVLLEESARSTLADTRSLVAASAPLDFAHGGLPEALARLGDRFTRETGIRVSVTSDSLIEIERDTEVVLLRCAQEGMANVRKHSRAGHARITLARSPDEVSLEVADDGAGFVPSPDDTGFGLSGLRDRLTLVGGSLRVTSSPGGGTTLTARLPVTVTA